MTPDDTALAELARKINTEGWTCLMGVHEPGYYDTCDDCRDACEEVAETVLPIIREAQERAWDDCTEYAAEGQIIPRPDSRFLSRQNSYRTNGATDEH